VDDARLLKSGERADHEQLSLHKPRQRQSRWCPPQARFDELGMEITAYAG